MRTTTTDQYSAFVKGCARQLKTGDISRRTFATLISLIWKVRGNA